MKTSSKKDFAYAMTPLKIVSWPVGTWPLQEYNVASTLRFIVTIFCLLLTVLLMQTEIYLDSSDAEKNLDIVLIFVCSVLAIAKVAAYRIYSADLVSNFASAVEDYNEIDGEEKRKIMRRHAHMGRVALGAVVVLSYVGSMTITFSKLLLEENEVTENVNASVEEELSYPLASGYTMKLLNLPESLYPVIFVVQYFMLIIVSTGNLGSDGLFFGITFHLCGQAEVLKQEFIKAVNDNENTAERFDALIKRHCHLLDLSEKLSNTVNFILIVQMLTSCILICTTGFQLLIAVAQRNITMTIKTFIVVFTLLVQMFAFSYIGEYLKSQMEGIGYSAYSCRWYNLPRRLAKDIVFIILRCQNPVHLKAGKFFIVNMETYMSILKTSVSYLSVLRLMVQA